MQKMQNLIIRQKKNAQLYSFKHLDILLHDPICLLLIRTVLSIRLNSQFFYLKSGESYIWVPIDFCHIFVDFKGSTIFATKIHLLIIIANAAFWFNNVITINQQLLNIQYLTNLLFQIKDLI